MEFLLAQKWETRFQLKPGTWVFVPTQESRDLGYHIKGLVEDRWRPPKNYFHLRDGGHVHAINTHIENSYFAHLDIQTFFGQINASRVTRWLKPLLGYSLAREYARASTVPHPLSGGSMLPFGFVQSPILASLCLFRSALGCCLAQLHKKFDVVVSIYMDDIIISAENYVVLSEAIKLVDDSAAIAGLPIHAGKREGPANRISAFNIDIAHHSLRIKEERWKLFLSDFKNSSNEFEREGIYNYVASVNSDQAKDLLI